MATMYKRRSDSATTDVKSSKKIKLQNGGFAKTTHTSKSFDKKRADPVVSKKANFAGDDNDGEDVNDEQQDLERRSSSNGRTQPSTNGKPENESVPNGNSSRESHAKQRQLALERKAAKPNADSIARSKKLWERLRRKSHVPKEERDKLVTELFTIISGQVKEFVFKHDAVRVIQCALKYASPAQKKQITTELQGSYRELAESKYAKFLIAKMVVGDKESAEMVVREFYGHVKRLIRHPEASWIMDDIYRGLATEEQKALLLREWYGPEFVVFRTGGKQTGETKEKATADLSEILKAHPEKRGHIMQHLKEMTNQLVQKKTTGFTMLHDALLQYFINTKPGSPEATELLEMLRDDEEGDLYKNLAFTKSGSRLVCLAIAYGSSKDRRTILKFFKTHIKLLSGDINGHLVLLAAYEAIDDTVMTGKAIFPELLSKDLGQEERDQELLGQALHLTARIPLLFLLAPEPPKWLTTDEDLAMLKEVREIRATTSKKEPETRRLELVKAISQPLLDLIASQAAILVESSFGCQFIAEVLLGSIGEKQAALEAVANLATPHTDEATQLISSIHAGRMFKTIVQGGRFDKDTKTIQLVDPPLKFHELLYEQLASQPEGIISWAIGPNAFAIVAMLEASDFGHRQQLEDVLRGQRKTLEHPSDDKAASAGTKIILEKIGAAPAPNGLEKTKKSKSKK